MIAWSFSSLEMYRNCPKQYQEVRELKNFVDDPNTEWRMWGNRVHEAMANALSKGAPLPQGMEVWQPIADKFKSVRGTLQVENQLAINEAFQPCTWFDKKTWARSVLDAIWIDGELAKVVDWKTGKQKSSDQLALFALITFCHFPQVQRVNTAFVWLKTGAMTPEKFTRADVPRLWQLFLPDVKRIEASKLNNVWTPRTSGLCNAHCPVVTCQFNGKRRKW